jgi:adenylyltransferase/sulfurtransferase
MPTVLIPSALKGFTEGQESVRLEGDTVGAALADLAAKFPKLDAQLFREGKLRSFVNVFAGDEDIRALQGLDTPVDDSQELMIVPSIAGGSTPTAEREELSADEIYRYSRHLIMPEVTMEGQKKLKKAKVLCVGTGGLGSPLAAYLTAAGVGTLGLIDFDVVDVTNLQRQILHFTPDVGKSKLQSASEKLHAMNPHVKLELHETHLDSGNALEIIGQYDIVADGTDNFPTRFLVNDACALLGKPNVYASIFRFEGQASVFDAKNGPCYRCVYPEPPPPGLVPSCAEGGVLGVLPGLVGTIQATEVIKLILGIGKPLLGRLLLIDALEMKFRELRLRKDPDCPVCGEHPTIDKLIDYYEFCGIRGEEHVVDYGVPEVSPAELGRELASNHPPKLLDVREDQELQISKLPNDYHIPVGRLAERVSELDSSEDLVVYCRSGSRSAQAVDFLQKAGFRKARNLEGGINAYAREVDRSLPVY